ncbi:FAD-binding and (Fe-S)-binding domain-containing protein [Oerskovia enterophila]|uniref:D-lactate dehydrogenase (cytochrome) n=1 Tax=Oerskovia enterophila TaxID=43678 RepID=A0A163SIU8_9CELL|nr:FAD-binding and (Fe-S)-binding domain-containing protein [Oerskovia enterophila]KZM36474.1 putative FAD-linked oxidoreductase [Oerskovia enterophila]
MTTVSAATTRALEIRTDLLTRVAQAHDASHYLLRPEAVARAQDVPDVVAAFAEARRRGLPVTFRSGGTSLSGQASGAGLLVDTRTRFTRVEVLDDGARVRCQPGVTLRSVNGRLLRHGRRLGPDPASEIACTIGGVVANNSSGMACGTVDTAYRTIESMTLVLPSGTVLDTGAPDADERLRALEPALHRGLAGLRDRVRASAAMRATIAHQYSMKNTMGYGVNAFVDHESPVKILEHLVVGSEGTLAFVADVTFRTVPLLPAASTTLLVFDALEQATEALATVTDSGARAIELLDAASLRVAAADPLADASMRAFATATTQTALLVEYQATGAAGLEPFEEAARAVVGSLDLATPAELTRDPAARGRLWRVRKGLYTAVAGARAPGSTALLEDLVVPVPDLTATVRDLGGLFAQHGYDDAVTFGHAKDGNLHFMITPRLSDDGELDRFAAFTEDMVGLVLGRGGSLKAEHGTGRIMAPFVRRQFGDDLYAVMREVKALCDPEGILNPGVLLTDDDEAHLQHLKLVPPVGTAAAGDLAAVVDRCVECGYCEPACPSRTVTTTPRQRIALLREMVTAAPGELRELERAYEYSAVDTCAVDSLCVTACPVGIDTGKVMKVRRAQRHGAVVQRAGRVAADHWGGAVTGLRGALGVVDLVPTPLVTAASKVGRAVLGDDVVPLVGPDLPGPGPRRVSPGDRPAHGPASVGVGAAAGASVVFFQSCMGSLFSPAEASPSPGGVGPAFLALCERAGISVAIPEGVGGLCCGTPWVSKGLTDGATAMAERTFDALWAATDGGRLPVVSDASSCTHGLEGIGAHLSGDARERFERLRVLDAVTFVRHDVLPALEATGLDPRTTGSTLASLVLHPTCSSIHLGVVGDLEAVARAVADDVVLPLDAGCCGFAGDRGMLHPELTAAAMHAEATEVAAHAREHGRADAYASSNRTCELGLSRATGEDYVHVVELLEAATRA